MLQPKIDVPKSIVRKRFIKSYILLRFIHFSMRMFMNYHQDVLICFMHTSVGDSNFENLISIDLSYMSTCSIIGLAAT